MIKVTVMGAGSAVFTKNLMGDLMRTPEISGSQIALYDINKERLEDAYQLVSSMNRGFNEERATIKKFLGVENRKEALRGADFVVNSIQVGGYEPSTVIDFEIPKEYGLRQTIGDTLGIGGIFRGLRTIKVMKEFAQDIEEVCPNAWFLNYTNPMAILTGYLKRYTGVKTIGLCHSVQVCTPNLLKSLEMETEGVVDKIAGINHMAWLLEVRDRKGNDLYPEIKKRAAAKNAGEKHNDMVRFDYIKHLGYYCTESSEHNAEYNPFYIKPGYPELIERFNIPLDEYPRRCENAIKNWNNQREALLNGGNVEHHKTSEYASYIINAMVTNQPYKIGGNVMNNGLITNLPPNACVEVPCLVDGSGINPIFVGELPPQLAAMNLTNINPQLLTIEAAVTRKKEHIYHAAMLDPRTGAQLSIDDIVSMCDKMIQAHEESGFPVL